MNYKDEIIKAMDMLAEHEKVIFLGQSIAYPGHIMYKTLENITLSKKIELPVFEDVQMGISIGLALEGYIPVSIFPRMDFLIIAANQLVNHLDKLEEMSQGEFRPRVIIRTMVGSKAPLDGGPQHTQDHTEALEHLLTNVAVIKLENPKHIMPMYDWALESNRSSILIEIADLY